MGNDARPVKSCIAGAASPLFHRDRVVSRLWCAYMELGSSGASRSRGEFSRGKFGFKFLIFYSRFFLIEV